MFLFYKVSILQYLNDRSTVVRMPCVESMQMEQSLWNTENGPYGTIIMERREYYIDGEKPEYQDFETKNLDNSEFLDYINYGFTSAQPLPPSPKGVNELFTENKRTLGDFEKAKFPSTPVYPKNMRLWKASFRTILASHD